MRNRSIALLTAWICWVACGQALAFGRGLERPHRFAPGYDAGLVQVQNPVDGRTWAAWTYRNGAELDIAVAVADADGFWSEPRFVGLDDGSDQFEPALAVDGAGTLYLAFVDRGSGAIVLTALRRGAPAWSPPVAVTDAATRGRAPSLAVVGDRLVVAYRTAMRVRIAELPLLSPPATSSPNQGFGINDGPDPTGMIDDGTNDGRDNGDVPPPIPLPREDPED